MIQQLLSGAFLYPTYEAHTLSVDNTLFSDPKDLLMEADEPSSSNVYALTLYFSPNANWAGSEELEQHSSVWVKKRALCDSGLAP